MPKEMGHVKNPLTVIAIFAGIAETSGAVILPFLDKDIQGVFVWFLMFFPCLLIAFFFGVLYRKHHVLYAPSDYKEDKSFVELHFTTKGNYKSFGRIEETFDSPQRKDAEDFEIPEEQADVMFEPMPPDSCTAEEPANEEKKHNAPSGVKPNQALGGPVEHMSLMPECARVTRNRLRNAARTRVLEGIVSNVGGVVKTEVQSKQFPNIRFDAVIDSSAITSVVEFVDMVSDSERLRSSVKGSLKMAKLFWDSLSEQEKGKFVFHLALMHGPESEPMRETALKDIADLSLVMPFETTVILYEYDAQHMISYSLRA